MLAHKADTEERHRGLSAASFATWPQLHPRAFISRSTDLLHVSWSSPPPVSGGGPAHGYSWNECRWHSVNMPNPPPPFFTSNEMGSIPVCSWSSASEFCSPKLCVGAYLFWTTSRMWHIPLVTFPDSAAYAQCIALENGCLCFHSDIISSSRCSSEPQIFPFPS